MALIKGYNQGADISLLDVRYRYSQPDENGKWGPDWLYTIYRDNKTGKKSHQVIQKPTYEYFVAKDNVPLYHNLLFIEKEKVNPIEVPFNTLLRDIAERVGKSQFYYDNLSNRNRAANMLLHTEFNIFNSDMHIEDNFRYRFDKQYTNTPIMPLSKAYFDIEADTINMVGDFPEMGECPINAVSYIFGNKVTSFLLRNPDNPLIEQFEKSIGPNLFNELNEFIIHNVGGAEQAEKFHVDQLQYEFVFYDDEIDLITDLFRLININEPDFLLAWNMAFDIPYIIERLKQLGYDPADILCHPSFEQGYRVAEYYIDERHKNEYEARGDRYDISSHTVFMDQLIQFASRRKGQAKFPNFKLDTAGSLICKVRKLDYSHITTDLAKLPYLDYKTFVFYNIMDTIVQKCIEEKEADVDYIYMKCLTNNTRYDKGHRQTVYLTNRATKHFWEEGFVIGNNLNRNAESLKFEGALVGDPTHNSDYSKVRLYNQVLNIAMNLLDFDYKSLYPSCALQDNMSPNTIIAKIEIDNPVFEKENPFNYPVEWSDMKDADLKHIYVRGGNFMNDIISENIIETCSRWFHYASFMEWLEDFKYYFENIEYPHHIMNRDKLFDTVPAKKQLFTVVNDDGVDHSKPQLFSDWDIDKDGKPQLFTYMPGKINYGVYLDKIGGLK